MQKWNKAAQKMQKRNELTQIPKKVRVTKNYLPKLKSLSNRKIVRWNISYQTLTPK